MRIRRSFWAKLHMWTGLLLGAVWMAQALTGLSLVFARDLEASYVLGAPNAAVAPARIIPIVLEDLPQPATRVRLVGSDARLLEFQYRDAQGQLHIMRYDAGQQRVLAQFPASARPLQHGGLIDILYQIHTSLMLGEGGKIWIGASGAFLLLSIFLGLYLAWPQRRLAEIFQIGRWSGVLQKLYGWHRMIGLLVVLPLSLMVATGVYIVFVRDRLPLTWEEASAPVPALSQPLTPRAALDKGAALFPKARFMGMDLPQQDQPYYTLRYTSPMEWRSWAGRSTVVLDARDGHILALYDPNHASARDLLDDAVYPTHTGEAGGLVGRVLVLLSSAALAALIATGLYRYIHKKQKKRR